MALNNVRKQYTRYVPQESDFYRDHYHHVIMGLMTAIVALILVVCLVLYQVMKRPLPVFHAIQANKQEKALTPFVEPNLLSSTILRWASEGATAAYTFDFVRYKDQIAAARSYFTDAGWNDYMRSVDPLLGTIVKNQLFVNGVVAGAPVISHQGDLSGKGYVWQIQMPFLVTYQSANSTDKRRYIVILSLVKVPTSTNPQGIGIDQFVMTGEE